MTTVRDTSPYQRYESEKGVKQQEFGFIDLPLELIEKICSTMDISTMRKFICTNKQYRNLCQPYLEEKVRATQIVVTDSRIVYFKIWDGQLLYMDLDGQNERGHKTHIVDIPLLTNVKDICIWNKSSITAVTHNDQWYIIQRQSNSSKPVVLYHKHIPSNTTRFVLRYGDFLDSFTPSFISLTKEGSIMAWCGNNLSFTYVPSVPIREIFTSVDEVLGIDQNNQLYCLRVITKGGSYSILPEPIDLSYLLESIQGTILPANIASLFRSDFRAIAISELTAYALSSDGLIYEHGLVNEDETDWEPLSSDFRSSMIGSGSDKTLISVDEKGGVHIAIAIFIPIGNVLRLELKDTRSSYLP